MSEFVNCERAGGVSGSNLTEETGPTGQVEDWDVDDWELSPVEPLAPPTVEAKPEQKTGHVCECCQDGFPDTNALQQHQRACSDCLVAFRALGVSEKDLYDAVMQLFRRFPDLRNKTRNALFSVLKNKDYTYRSKHSRWLLFWLTKLGLIELGKDTSISLTECQALLKPNLEESLMLCNRFNWQVAPAINGWTKKFRDLLQLRKIDHLDQFVLLESVAEFNAARQAELARRKAPKTTHTKKTAEEKETQQEAQAKALSLKERITQLNCAVPVGAGEASFIPKSERLIRLLEAIEAQRAQFDLPARSQGNKFSFGSALLSDEEQVTELIDSLSRMTQVVERMQDKSTNFQEAWKAFWEMVKTVPPIFFNNPLDIVRQRMLDEKGKMKSPQRKKCVVELGQLMKCKEAKDDRKMLYYMKDAGFLEECQQFFKEG